MVSVLLSCCLACFQSFCWSFCDFLRLTGYLQDVCDDVDGSLEDASHLMEKCLDDSLSRGAPEVQRPFERL